MKNVLIGIVGGMILVYMVVIQISLYTESVRQNELNQCVADVTMQVLKGCRNQTDEAAQKILTDRIRERLPSDSEVQIDVLACDMQKGIVSAKVKEQFLYPNGKCGSVQASRTAIAEKKAENILQARIIYKDHGEIYKEYMVQTGETHVAAKLPDGAGGWKLDGKEAILHSGESFLVETDMNFETVY